MTDGSGGGAEAGAAGAPSGPATAWLRSLLTSVDDAALRERLLTAALESVTDPIVIADREAVIQWANPAFTRLSGFLADEVHGRPLRLPPATELGESAWEGAWQEILAGRGWHDVELFEDRDGLRHQVRRTFTPVLEGRQATHVIVSYLDLTSRATLQEDHRLFVRTLNAVLLFDDDGRVLEANPAAGQLTGYSAAEVPDAVALADLIVDADRGRFLDQWDEFHATGQAQGHYVMCRRDGELIDVEYHAVANVRPGVHLATIRDVTEERRIQRELEFQSKVLESAGESVIVTSPSGLVEYWNRQAEELYEWTADEVLGRHILDVTTVETAIPTGDDVKSTLARGETWSGEMLVRSRRSGRYFPVWTTSTPLLDDGGHLTGVIGVSRDVSELRQAQEQAQRRAAQQEVVAQLGREVLDVRDLDVVLQRACEVLADVLDVELVEVLELSDERGRLRVRAGVGWGPDVVGRLRMPVSEASQATYTIEAGEPVVVDDIAEEQRFDPPARLLDRGVTSGITVVIPRQQETYGVLGVHSHELRPFTSDDAIFLRSVANVLGAAVDRHQATAELERLALFDGLTGLPNRTLLLDRLERAIGRPGRTRGRLSVLLADLQGLKLINDALGRGAGDDLLVEVARRITSLVPESTTVARVGDDEFVIVYEYDTDDEALASSRSVELARRLSAVVADHYELGRREVFVSVSVGIAVQTGTDDGPALVRKAESASRQSKERPGESITLYEPDAANRVGAQLELVNQLRHALMNDEFVVAYQPEVDLRTGDLFGLEALVRWEHPTRGRLGPAAFLETADQVGLLGPIGQRVLREACRHAAGLLRRYPELDQLAIAVNVAADQLIEPGFVTVVETALRQAGLAPERLFLEITEGAIIEDHDRTLATLEQLRRIGVQIALDDFGTGFSSLTHLHRFPIDLIKIDKSFVDRVTEGGAARMIVEATLGLARTLGLRCVAEGVETDGDLRELQALGCELGQGYLWSRPLVGQELEPWLTAFCEESG